MTASTAEPETAPEVTQITPYLNRELSWLDFNARVLDLAEDEKVPLLERAKFLAIFSTNLDEFFQVRVAGVKDQLFAGLPTSGIDNISPREQLLLIRSRALALTKRHCQAFARLCPALAEAGIELVDWSTLDTDTRHDLKTLFDEQIFPVLTPLAVDPGHPFPYISNLSLNLAVVVEDPRTGDNHFARVKVPPLLPRFIPLRDGVRFLALEQLIAAHLSTLFPGMEVLEHAAFRVTRDADLALEEGEADDLLAAVEMELRQRRFGEAVRLEIEKSCTEEVRALLVRELRLEDDDVYTVSGLVDLSGLWALHSLERPHLKDEPWSPSTQPGLATANDGPVDLFAVIRDRDVLVHHPYDSFSTSVEAFVAQAAADPAVLAIKQTLYRTSGDSPIIESLMRAADAGKQVAVLVEVKARFDEQNNIAWAKALESVGVHVVYGVIGLKTHSKTALVVRQEADGLRRYCHIGTGNYNPKTARLYEDVGLLTADAEVGADLSDLFNMLTGYGRRTTYRRILLAPARMRDQLLERIAAEAALPQGRIIMKMNALADAAVIDALYAASQGGARIDLIVRGICCLRPGLAGLSENITVRSIVGRYLEHSRVFAFEGLDEIVIGSADMMPRNLDRRIEVAMPVADTNLKARLRETLELCLADDTNTWELDSDGRWNRTAPATGTSVQHGLHEQAQMRAKQRREELAAFEETPYGSPPRARRWLPGLRGSRGGAA